MIFNETTSHELDVTIENRGQASWTINLPRFDGSALGCELVYLSFWLIPVSVTLGIGVRLFMWTAGFAE